MLISGLFFFFFCLEREKGSTLYPQPSFSSLLQPFLVLSFQTQAPWPFFRNVILLRQHTQALKQGDLGFLSHPHLSAESEQIPEQTHLISGLSSSGARGYWCMASTFPRQRRDTSSDRPVVKASPQEAERKGIF